MYTNKDQKRLFTNRMTLKGKYYSHHVGTKHFKPNDPQNECCLDVLIFTSLL